MKNSKLKKKLIYFYELFWKEKLLFSTFVFISLFVNCLDVYSQCSLHQIDWDTFDYGLVNLDSYSYNLPNIQVAKENKMGLLTDQKEGYYDYMYAGEIILKYDELTDETDVSDLFLCFKPQSCEFYLLIDINNSLAVTWDLEHKKISINMGLLFGNPLSSGCSSFGHFQLYKKFDFSNEFKDTQNNDIPSTTKNLIVLIHGWNPDPDENKYEDGYWPMLIKSIEKALIDYPDWKLFTYNWSADAATGPPSIIGGYKNGVQAAEIAHQHGQHLGELLRCKLPNLEAVHFIAHSAGTWAARSAALDLAFYTDALIQITLLDRFIPNKDSQLCKSRMDELDEDLIKLRKIRGNNKSPVYYLENYYTTFDYTDFGCNDCTEGDLNWSLPSINRKIDNCEFTICTECCPIDCITVYPYGAHNGPIKYYSETILGYNHCENLPEISGLGWNLSMAKNGACIEPTLIIGAPSSSFNLTGSYALTATTTGDFNSVKFRFRLPGNTQYELIDNAEKSGNGNWSLNFEPLKFSTIKAALGNAASMQITISAQALNNTTGYTIDKYLCVTIKNDLETNPITGGGVVTPENIIFNAQYNEGDPSGIYLSLKNISNSPFHWTAFCSADWLTLNQDEEDCDGIYGCATAVNAHIAGLFPGPYNANITITADGIEGSPFIVPVTLNITESTPPQVLSILQMMHMFPLEVWEEHLALKTLMFYVSV
jgi:hypothetical protein